MTAQLAELGITTATAFRASTIPGVSPDGLPQRAWDLDGLRLRYDQFIASTGSLRERTLAGATYHSSELTMAASDGGEPPGG